jgi:hypothetical protein
MSAKRPDVPTPNFVVGSLYVLCVKIGKVKARSKGKALLDIRCVCVCVYLLREAEEKRRALSFSAKHTHKHTHAYTHTHRGVVKGMSVLINKHAKGKLNMEISHA